MGKDYLPALVGIEEVFSSAIIEHAEGRIGSKMKDQKEWLQRHVAIGKE